MTALRLVITNSRSVGRPRGHVPLPNEPGRFMIAALASLTDCFTMKKYSAAKLVVGWFCDRGLVAEVENTGKIVDVAIAYPRDRKDGNSAIKGPADRLVRHLEEIRRRGNVAEHRWLDECKVRFLDLMCGLALVDQPRIDRAIQRLRVIDPRWPEVVSLLCERLEKHAVAELRKLEHDPLPKKMSSLFAALVMGAEKLKAKK
jgi:hypothetical protein